MLLGVASGVCHVNAERSAQLEMVLIANKRDTREARGKRRNSEGMREVNTQVITMRGISTHENGRMLRIANENKMNRNRHCV